MYLRLLNVHHLPFDSFDERNNYRQYLRNSKSHICNADRVSSTTLHGVWQSPNDEFYARFIDWLRLDFPSQSNIL